MSQQLSLLGDPKPKASNFSLFLALFPDLCTASQITELAANLRLRQEMSGKLCPVRHLHVTLHHLDFYPEVPEEVVEAVGRVCRPVVARTTPFDVHFDRVKSLHAGPGHSPLVLTEGENGNPALVDFRRRVGLELARHGLGKASESFLPHVTLLYDKHNLPESLIDPVSWTVRDLMLIGSEVGLAKYHELGCWKLRG